MTVSVNDIFYTAYQYIQDDVDRPEMEDIIKRRIQRALMALHRIDFWKRDFIEQIYAFQYTQAVQILKGDLLPRLRAFGYIRKYNADLAAIPDPNIFDGAVGDFFKEINPQTALDGYGTSRENTFYRAQNDIKILSSEAISYVLIGWFRDPLIEPLGASDSWVLTGYPSLVAAHAKRRIFKDIGKDEESRAAKEEYDEELAIFLANNIRVAVLQQPG